MLNCKSACVYKEDVQDARDIKKTCKTLKELILSIILSRKNLQTFLFFSNLQNLKSNVLPTNILSYHIQSVSFKRDSQIFFSITRTQKVRILYKWKLWIFLKYESSFSRFKSFEGHIIVHVLNVFFHDAVEKRNLGKNIDLENLKKRSNVYEILVT